MISNIYVIFLVICNEYVAYLIFFFFNDTATTEIYTLSLHDALPICGSDSTPSEILSGENSARQTSAGATRSPIRRARDRKSTRLNSSHSQISYAVFCLKKKKIHHRLRNVSLPLLVNDSEHSHRLPGP